MSAKSVVSAFAGFLAHHVGDLSAIHSALTDIVGVVPIDSQDKDRINSVLETVQNSVENINNFLQGNTYLSGGEVVVKESDIVAALGNFFASDTGKAAIANAVEVARSSTEGNVSA